MYIPDSCLVLANIALSFDDELDEAYYIKGNYYLQYGEVKKSLDCYDKALELNPNYYMAYHEKGYLLEWGIQDFTVAIDNYQRALKICRGDKRPSLIRELGNTYLDIGFIDKAKYYFQEAFALDGNKAENFICLASVELDMTNFEEAFQLAKNAYATDTSYLESMLNFSLLARHNNEAYKYAKKLIDYYEKKDALNLGNSHSFGYVFYQQGKYKEAENYFHQQIKNSEESIKLHHENYKRNLASACLAQTYAFLGDRLKAYYYLDELTKMKVHTLWMLTFMKHWPMYDTIRKEKRFQNILQTMEEKYQTEHERVKKWLIEEKML